MPLLRPVLGPADRRNALLIALLGLMLGGLYFVAIDLHDPLFIFDQQQKVIAGSAGSPYRYRVLVPVLLEVGTRAFAFAGSAQMAFLHASAVYDCLGLGAQLLSLYVLLRLWFPPIHSLVGVGFTSSLTVMTFSYFTYQPWSILEVLFFSLGFVCAYRGKWVLVGVLVILAALNRETGVFLPLALLLASFERLRPLSFGALRNAAARRETRLSFFLLLVSTAVFAGLRLLRGGAAPGDELGDVIVRNVQRNNLLAAGIAVPLFLGFGWIFAVRGLASAPRFMRRVARVVPFYLAAFAIWGWWREVRILTSLYPIFVPLVLAYCYLPRPSEIGSNTRYTLAEDDGRPVQRHSRRANQS